MRRTSRGGWLSRLAAKRQKSWAWHPEFEPQNRKPGQSVPVTPFECRAEHGAPICGILRRTRPSSHFTCGGVSTFSANARFDPTTAAALSYSVRLALAAVGRGTSRASNNHAAARFRARWRDCGGGVRVPRGALV